MMSVAPPHDQFSPSVAHKIVADLMRPRLAVYWLDLLASLAVTVTAFAATAALVAAMPLLAALTFVVSVLAGYRAMIFIHEIVHFRSRRQFTAFRRCWNVVVGIPMFMPVFMYECHGEHHNQHLYGTRDDPEYLPLARLAPAEIVKLVLAAPLLPFFGPLRFGVLTPIAWLVPRLRAWVYANMSSLKLDVEYQGRPPSNAGERRSWLVQELGCLALFWLVVAGVALGFVPWPLVLQWYLTYAGIALLDTARLLGAHRYLGDEDRMSVVEQMLDTYNYPRRRALAELWAPVGLRLHALHHLLPGLPYHAYQAAHERLVTQLPATSPYRMTESPSLLSSVRQLWRTSRAAPPSPQPVAAPLPRAGAQRPAA